jgi:hypothetical protein
MLRDGLATDTHFSRNLRGGWLWVALKRLQNLRLPAGEPDEF